MARLLPIRQQRPSYRVARAMWRITRDRWMDYEDIRRICMALCRCASGAPHTVFDSVVANECMAVGMFRGKPPAFLWDPNYVATLRAIKAAKKKGGASVELALLSISGKSIVKGLYANNW